MAAAMDSPNTYPESPMDQEDVVYPCKGCGEILEEGKAFELAGNRWHIDCFRCNTCHTLLDSDANLLLLGDGSLICNNCTYSCSTCGNKIEDLAILTGDQAFCSGCFRCRNCKRKIENLRYARTSQGIFCMSCHESLMARRRKKARAPKPTSAGATSAEKALPSLPPGAAVPSAFTPETETTPDAYSDSQSTPQQAKSPRDTHLGSRNGASANNFRRDASPLFDELHREEPAHPPSTYSDSSPPSNLISTEDDDDDEDDDDPERGFLPMAFDPTPIPNAPQQAPPSIPIRRKEVARTQEPSPPAQKENQPPRDYFGASGRKTLARDGLQDSQRTAAPSTRSVSTDREQERSAREPKPSPHILFQEKGRSRKRDTSGASTPVNGSSTASPIVASSQEKAASKPKAPALATDPQTLSQQEAFKLQDVPKSAKERSRANSRVVSPIDENNKSTIKIPRPLSPASGGSTSDVNPFDDPRRRKASQAGETVLPPKHADRGLPLRGDSLNATASKTKSSNPSDVATPTATASNLTPAQQRASTHERTASTSSVPLIFPDAHSTVSRGNSSSRPEVTDPPNVDQGSFDAGPPPRAANRPTAPSRSVANGDFIAPRHAPPPPPPTAGHGHNDSVSTIHSADGRRASVDAGLAAPSSGGLPKYTLDGGFSMDDEMGRIMRGEQPQSNSTASVLRRVSNAVKHGRSFSDRANVGGKSPRNMSADLGFPLPTSNITSPTSVDGMDSLRASLIRAQKHIAELESEKVSLQDQLHGSADIRAVNTELREKRSTMAILDTQREMVVRELEVMTEHLAKAKDNSQPLDLGSLKTSILRDFAESLQKLKDGMSTQIEDLVHKRNELTDEIGNLIQMKDKGFQEYESLSSKNTQLLQHNNELLRSIQSVYQDNRGANGASGSGTNGLGIYPGSRVETPGPGEVRSLNIVNTDSGMPTLLQDHPDADTGTVVAAPQMVDIRKGVKANKFNWRRGGEKITGKVAKGLKGAFTGTDRPPAQGQYSIGLPYSATQQAIGGSESGGPNSAVTGYNFFNQKQAGGKQGTGLGHLKNNSNPNLAVTGDGSVLFGSELSDRCTYENSMVPSIVHRCITEVEARGMDVEGIYRKSGGAGQVKSVQQGFEKDDKYDISDPDLDIHAVTSALKQYFRKLPTPLIVYGAYDSLLEAGQVQDKEKQAAALRDAVNELPDTHHSCLEILIGHLARVMGQESQNLMTPLNLAVVFAPTIMRPLTIEREMSDMQVQRQAVQALLEHHATVFAEEASE